MNSAPNEPGRTCLNPSALVYYWCISDYAFDAGIVAVSCESQGQGFLVSPHSIIKRTFPREDVAISGTVIPRGDRVMGVIAAADHDPKRFADPEVLDITRTDNRHLAFGKGIHHCLGAPLVRMEGQIAIGTLLRRMPDLRLKESPGSLAWRPSMVLRGLKTLPVKF